MELHINSWGNSLGLRLPKAIAEMLGVTSGSSVDAQVIDGKLIVSPDPAGKLKRLSRGYSLKELMARANSSNNPAADEELRAWRDAKPVGKEIIEDGKP